MSEVALTNRIVKAVQQEYGARVCVEKRHGTQYGKVGQPDLTGCLDGVRFEIEVKFGKNKPTQMQYARLKEWSMAGAVVGVAWSVEDAMQIVQAAEREGARN